MKDRKKTRILAGAALAIVLALSGLGAWFFHARAEKAASKASPSSKEEILKVESRSVSDDIEVSGHLKPKAEQELRAPLDGIVETVYAREGDRLRRGEAIAALDSTAARFAVQKLAYDMDQERFAGNKRKLDLLAGEFAVRQRAVDDLTIRAHFDGTLSSLNLKPGDVLVAGTSYGRIIDVTSLVANVEIAESDIPRARKGLPVVFRFPALPGLSVQGRLESFASEARINDRRLTVLDATLVIDAPPPGLLPAYSFSAVIGAGQPRKVLVVDARAVGYEGGKPFVRRRDKAGAIERRDVVTEGFGSGLVAVIAGLAEGDEVLAQAGPGEAGR